jgi:uncharacterized protein YkwD
MAGILKRLALGLSPALIVAALALAGGAPAALAEGAGCGSAVNSNPQKLSNGKARDVVLCLINRERAEAGLRPFDRHRKLQKAAQRHNDRMDGTGCFSHQCPGEAVLDTRLESVGYLGEGLSAWGYGENIVWGMGSRGTPRAVVAAWMHSSGHRANILSRDFRDIGVGFSAGTPMSNDDPGGIYTTDFGLAVH